jgi:hypothetical protein
LAGGRSTVIGSKCFLEKSSNHITLFPFTQCPSQQHEIYCKWQNSLWELTLTSGTEKAEHIFEVCGTTKFNMIQQTEDQTWEDYCHKNYLKSNDKISLDARPYSLTTKSC